MDDKQYLVESLRTLAPQSVEQRSVSNQHLYDALTVTQAGNVADRIKRRIFYQDNNTQSRFEIAIEQLVKVDEKIAGRRDLGVLSQEQTDMLHAALGVGSEAGELMQEIVDSIADNREIDSTNMIEEVGDILWYLAIVCRTHGFTLAEAMDKNISKLSARYPEKFTSHHAVNRDLDKELKVLKDN